MMKKLEPSSQTLSRRGVLGGMAALAATPLLQGSASAAPVPAPSTLGGSAGFRLRAQHGATVLAGGWILVAGGYTPGRANGILSDAQLYDPINDEWHNVAPMGTARARFSLIGLPDGRALAIAGVGHVGLLGGVEIFDPGKNAWSSLGSLSSPRADHVATFAGNSILITGGFTGSLERPLPTSTEHFRLKNIRSGA